MRHSLDRIEQQLCRLNNQSRMDTFRLYPGIDLSFITLEAEEISLPHDPLEHMLEINYCKDGRMGWNLENGNAVYLGAGDYSLHTMDECAASVMTLPNGYYRGLALCIDLKLLSHSPPELLAGAGITGEFLLEKFCGQGRHTSFGGTGETQSIFGGFYGQPQELRLPYYKLKALELLLYLGRCTVSVNDHLADYHSDQVEIIRSIHRQLSENLDKHFTIEALAKQFLINPTTLKSVFKAVYGNSIAAHTREHRMEHAARLLAETQDSIAQVAQATGYGNQSKFTSAFKEYYHLLPTEYRKLRRG